ncbi:DciA family protein [Streptomyces sp. NPDC018059]|uniref:DciA family protein n=1 Tax=Streptomyces sp. NPDC018059 TaxID=3365041 RepID=UPI0037B4CC6E
MSAEQLPGSGADLARVALRQAKAAARARGNAPKKTKRQSYRHTRGDGRDPRPLMGVMKQLVVDRGWERAAAGGNLVARWPEILGSRAQHWQAQTYDEDTGTLTVLCTSSAWATSLQLTARQIVAEVNQALGRDTLQQITIRRATGSAGRRSPEPAATVEDSPSPAPTHRFRPTGAQPGTDYRAAREGLRAERIAAKTGRSAPEPHFTLKEPEEAFTDAVELHEQLTAEAQRREDPRARALARARRERAAGASSPADQPALQPELTPTERIPSCRTRRPTTPAVAPWT